MNVYQKLGLGLLESVYQKALMIELDNACLLCEEEVPINVVYNSIHRIKNLEFLG